MNGFKLGNTFALLLLNDNPVGFEPSLLTLLSDAIVLLRLLYLIFVSDTRYYFHRKTTAADYLSIKEVSMSHDVFNKVVY